MADAAMRILLVEDEQTIAVTLSDDLEAAGHEVQHVADGKEAISELQRRSFDVVITDLGMKGMDGVELIEKIRATKPQQLIAVVSGWPEESVLRRFSSQQQPHWFLQKPVKMNELEQILRSPPQFAHLGHTV